MSHAVLVGQSKGSEKMDGSGVKLIMAHQNRPSMFDECQARDLKER